MDEEEKYIVVTNMLKYGGSFVVALGVCIDKADPINYHKLKNCFPEYWKEYYNDRKLMR